MDSSNMALDVLVDIFVNGDLNCSEVTEQDLPEPVKEAFHEWLEEIAMENFEIEKAILGAYLGGKNSIYLLNVVDTSEESGSGWVAFSYDGEDAEYIEDNTDCDVGL
jgi:hypothetical protein